jgi:hypothetical protein
MATYKIKVNGEVTATFEANFNQAGSGIELNGRATPYQVSDAKHDPDIAAEMLNGWCHSEGGSIWQDGDHVRVVELPDITEICVYYDVQDFGNERWAVKWYKGSEIRGSESLDAETLEKAIDEVIMTLGLGCQAGDFATSRDEGGYAIWTSDFAVR